MFYPIISSTRAWALALALALAATGPAWAQASVSGAALPPSLPGVPHVPIAVSVSTPAYLSAFDGYRGFADQPVTGWAAANQDAADVGGWRAYAKAARSTARGGAMAPASSGQGGGHAGPDDRSGSGSPAGPDGHASSTPGRQP